MYHRPQKGRFACARLPSYRFCRISGRGSTPLCAGGETEITLIVMRENDGTYPQGWMDLAPTCSESAFDPHSCRLRRGPWPHESCQAEAGAPPRMSDSADNSRSICSSVPTVMRR